MALRVVGLYADPLANRTRNCGHREYRIHLFWYSGCCWLSRTPRKASKFVCRHVLDSDIRFDLECSRKAKTFDISSSVGLRKGVWGKRAWSECSSVLQFTDVKLAQASTPTPTRIQVPSQHHDKRRHAALQTAPTTCRARVFGDTLRLPRPILHIPRHRRNSIAYPPRADRIRCRPTRRHSSLLHTTYRLPLPRPLPTHWSHRPQGRLMARHRHISGQLLRRIPQEVRHTRR
jgi:hypothetical protein